MRREVAMSDIEVRSLLRAGVRLTAVLGVCAGLGGTAYAARCGVFNAGEVARTRRILKKAFQSQLDRKGFSFVEILTMCPTGWFIPTQEGPEYLDQVLGSVHRLGEFKGAE